MKVMSATLLAPANNPNPHIKIDSTTRAAIVIETGYLFPGYSFPEPWLIMG